MTHAAEKPAQIWPFAAALYERFNMQYKETPDDTIAMYGRMVHNAICQSAVYTSQKTIDDLSAFSTPDRRKAFTDSVQANTCAIHNIGDDLRGDEQAEESILFDYVLQDGIRLGVLFVRSADSMTATGFTYFERDASIAVWPYSALINRKERQIGLSQSILLKGVGPNIETEDKATLKNVLLCYFDAWVFIDAAIGATKTNANGNYGFGVGTLTIMDPAMMFPEPGSMLLHPL
jgi:hypothetical protein